MDKGDLELFNEIVDDFLKWETDTPIPNPIPPDKLYQKLDIALTEEGAVADDFKSALKSLVEHTPKTASRLFFNQLFGGRKSKAVLGDLVATLLNNSMYTFKVAGPMIGVEKEIINHIINLVGYDNTAGGSFASGGSMTNFMAMLMARDHFVKNVVASGVKSNLICYTSIESHYSIPKNASLMGTGRDNVRFIPTDDKGSLLAEALEKEIQKDIALGNIPIFVNATAGTTVLGAFDPIRAMAEICKKYKVWLHVDGAYCGGVIFSDKYKKLVDGIELSDSFSINGHKMLGTPLTCSIIVTRHKQALYHSFSNEASYLYQSDLDEYNPGKTSLQCGRRNDALKLWCLWKAIGTKGLRHYVEHQFHLADIARNYVRNHPDYKLHSFDNSIAICFSYKDIPSIKLCQKMHKEAALLVSFGIFKEQEFVRMVTINSSNSEEEILGFFKAIESFTESDVLV